MTHTYTTTVPARLSARPARNGRRTYHARFVRAGRITTADGTPGAITVSDTALVAALARGMFDGLAVGVDHPSFFEGPRIERLAGITHDTEWIEADLGVAGQITLYDNEPGRAMQSLFDQILDDAQAGLEVPDVGLSIVFWPEWDPESDDLIVINIRHVEGIDFVLHPAADGRVLAALSAALHPPPSTQLPGSATPEPPATGDAATSNPAPVIANTGATVPNLGPPSAPADGTASVPRDPLPPEAPSGPNSAPSQARTVGGNPMPEELNTPQAPTQAPVPEDNSTPDSVGTPSQWSDALAHAATIAMLQAADLPQVSIDRLSSQHYDSPADLETAIAAERAYLATLAQDNVVQIGGNAPRSHISLGPNSLEQVELALEAMIMGQRPPAGVAPLTGLREFYHLMSGDFEMTGLFQPDRVMFANVTSSTMAGVTANALNKAVINQWANYPRWWEPIVLEEDFQTLQQVKWITLGGIGELPTVAEGAAYTELAWDDNTETADFVKKGGYLGITLEAIDKDDTRRLRAAPRALAQGAWLTLGKSVSAIFTSASGLGPNLADGTALFDASRSNLGSTALSWTEYNVVRTAMMKHTDLNSGERLGALTAPKYIVVPIDLEITALQILASEGQPGTANNDTNPHVTANSQATRIQNAQRRVVVCPLWTDTNNWAAVADPNLYPSIGIGYRYGRQPEVFSVASPTAGLMFTNDTMPVKVRFFFAVGPTDHRGLYKENVA